MSIGNLIKRLQDIMRNDAGVNGDAQRIEQIVWILFLKVYDSKEKFWEFEDENYVSIIPEAFRWRNWAVDNKDGNALTGDDLLKFVNDGLFPALKEIEVTEDTPINNLTKQMFQSYEDGYRLIDDIMTTLTGESFTTLPED